ncbi:tyrosine-type recombinase/integrase [Micromonospora mirobrigensis]|uniref:Site-specific recombinase XerD n=1 Tax=Micromonospora mirobrigensis TaxID=262898 RepID=A0A1C4XD87_9ACTN|nr:site-specific integrase [Micromonospora mirobrigensis]SCF06415.1 Site-specific recombinase XerD [Micromonospora mirobrigensis]
MNTCIKKVVLKSGEIRWRFVMRLGRDAADKPIQKTYTFPTKKAAEAEWARLKSQKATGVLVLPSALTLATYLESWLGGKRNLRVGTRNTYANYLKPFTERLGNVPVQKLTKTQVDETVDWMLSSGRRIRHTNNPGLTATSVNRALTVLSQALDSAVKQGLTPRNVVTLVERPTCTPKQTDTWTAQEAAAFLNHVSGHRLYPVWLLTLCGLRRGEVLGMRWAGVDLKGTRAREHGFPAGTPTITVEETRVSVNGVIHAEQPKSERGRRTLPLDQEMVSALSALQKLQRQERKAAGPAYEDHGLVCVDELGRPYPPDGHSKRFKRLAKAAGLPVIRLHDARHTCGTLMHLRGVPTAVISAWLGHSSAAFTMKTYIHSQADSLAQAGLTLRSAVRVKKRLPVAAVR